MIVSSPLIFFFFFDSFYEDPLETHYLLHSIHPSPILDPIINICFPSPFHPSMPPPPPPILSHPDPPYVQLFRYSLNAHILLFPHPLSLWVSAFYTLIYTLKPFKSLPNSNVETFPEDSFCLSLTYNPVQKNGVFFILHR